MDAALVIAFCLFLVESNESGVLFRYALHAPRSITRHSTSRCVSTGMLVRLTALLLSASRTVLFLAGCHLLMHLGTGRVQKQHGLESSAELADLRGPEASVPHHRSRIAVPMAIAHAAGREWHEHVLYAGSDLAVCAHMFQEHQVPLRFEHAPDLTQAALRITHRTEDECHDDAIEMLIRERERFDRGLDQVDGNGSSSQALPCVYQHRLVWLDRLHAHDVALLIKGEVLTSTGTHFQHDPLCLTDSFAPQ